MMWLRRYLRREGPFDLLHCHSSKAGLLGRLAALGTGVRVCYTPNALYSMSPKLSAPLRTIASLVESSLARFTDCVIAVSQMEYQHARQIGIPEERLSLTPNGIDTVARRPSPADRRALRASLGIGEREVCLGFIGRIAPQKAIDHLLAAFAVLHREFPAALRLVIVGEGALRPSLQSSCSAQGLDGAVAWLGECNGEEIMPAFDIFVLPSDFEGFPYVLLEALAAHLPIVSTEVGGASEAIEEGVNGFVVPRRDLTCMVDALRRLISNERLRLEMGEAAAGAAGSSPPPR